MSNHDGQAVKWTPVPAAQETLNGNLMGTIRVSSKIIELLSNYTLSNLFYDCLQLPFHEDLIFRSLNYAI